MLCADVGVLNVDCMYTMYYTYISIYILELYSVQYVLPPFLLELYSVHYVLPVSLYLLELYSLKCRNFWTLEVKIQLSQPKSINLINSIFDVLFSKQLSFFKIILFCSKSPNLIKIRHPLKELSLWNKNKYLNLNIFRTRCCKPNS